MATAAARPSASEKPSQKYQGQQQQQEKGKQEVAVAQVRMQDGVLYRMLRCIGRRQGHGDDEIGRGEAE
ncbi:MAG: hypothetical protein H0X25_10775 [Acidobacteriales bacterium]|nr:hypothetical protein [Terriglobales bacterium]